MAKPSKRITLPQAPRRLVHDEAYNAMLASLCYRAQHALTDAVFGHERPADHAAWKIPGLPWSAVDFLAYLIEERDAGHLSPSCSAALARALAARDEVWSTTYRDGTPDWFVRCFGRLYPRVRRILRDDELLFAEGAIYLGTHVFRFVPPSTIASFAYSAVYPALDSMLAAARAQLDIVSMPPGMKARYTGLENLSNVEGG